MAVGCDKGRDMFREERGRETDRTSGEANWRVTLSTWSSQTKNDERTNEGSNDDKLSNKPRTKQKSRCTHLGTSEGDYGGEQQGGEYELHDDGVDGRNAATTERQWLAMIWVAVIVF